MSRTFRGWLYLLAKLLGDIDAVCQGKVGKRAGRRIAGRSMGKILRKLFK